MKTLTQERLYQLLHYNPDTGEWFWKENSGFGRKPKNQPAGSLHPDGYRYIKIDGKTYKSSRLAFLYMTGKFPTNTADHIDKIRNNDRWGNLRDATRTEQCLNRTKFKRRKSEDDCLPKGVYRSGKKYQVSLKIDYKFHYFGTYESISEASSVAEEMASKHRMGINAK